MSIDKQICIYKYISTHKIQGYLSSVFLTIFSPPSVQIQDCHGEAIEILEWEDSYSTLQYWGMPPVGGKI